jgi:hypothetical protein
MQYATYLLLKLKKSLTWKLSTSPLKTLGGSSKKGEFMLANDPANFSYKTDFSGLLRYLQNIPMAQRNEETDKVITILEEAILGKHLHISENIAYSPELAHIWRHVSIRMLQSSLEKNGKPAKLIRAIEHISLFIDFFHPHEKHINHIRPETIIKAIDEKLMDAVIALIELGADINGSSFHKRTPLTHAINTSNILMVDLLLKHNADPNLPDAMGVTPLIAAVSNGDLNIIKCLIDNGANLDQYCKATFTTPQQYAIFLNKHKVYELLHQHGANNKLRDAAGLDHLSFAKLHVCSKEMQDTLKKTGQDNTLAEEKMLRKELAHIWGIGGKSDFMDEAGNIYQMDLEGLTRMYSRDMMLKYLDLFFKKSESNILRPEEKESIREAFKNSIVSSNVCLYNVMNRIAAKKPCIIIGGTYNHLVSSVIFNNSLVISNRGEGRYPKASNYFRLPTTGIPANTIQNLGGFYPNISDYYLHIIALNLPYLGGTDMKSQRIGNCSWASPKASLLSILRMYLEQDLGKFVYKQFTLFCRRESYISYMKSSKMPDVALLEKIFGKVKKKKIEDKVFLTAVPS